MKNILSRLVCFFIVLTLTFPAFPSITSTHAYATTEEEECPGDVDATGPTYVTGSLEVDGTSFNVGDQITIRCKWDDETGVKIAYVSYTMPLSGKSNLVTLYYNSSSGFWEATLTVTDSWEPGLWKTAYISAYDKTIAEYRTEIRTNLNSGDFWVNNDAILDTKSPEYINGSLEVNGNSFNVGDQIKIRCKWIDESGVKIAYVCYTMPLSGKSNLVTLTYNPSSGYWEATLTVTSNWEPGLWKTSYISAYDTTINEQRTEIRNGLSSGDFSIKNNSFSDASGPEYVDGSLKINGTYFDVGSQIIIHCKWTDESGIKIAYVCYTMPLSGKSNLVTLTYNPSLELWEATLAVTNSWEPGLWKINYISAYDKTPAEYRTEIRQGLNSGNFTIKNAHSWDDGQVTEATCTEKGYILYSCQKCDATRTVYLDALGHQNENGICTRCGEVDPEYTPPHTHVYSSEIKENIVEPTCTQEGSYDLIVYCDDCGEILSINSFIEDALGHNYETGVCTRCNEADPNYEPPHVHSELPAVKENIIEATCTQDGSYDMATYCSDCDDEISRTTFIVTATGHNYTYEITSPASCTDNGTKTFVCSYCADSFTENIDALGHDFINGKCTRCYELDPNYEPPHVHSELPAVKENIIEATCTQDGSYDMVVYCSDCDDEINRTTIIVTASGHNYTCEITSPASCTDNGSKTFVCSYCSYSSTENIDALGHNFINGKCARCDEVDPNYQAPHTHSKAPAVKENIVKPTCTKNGSYDSVVYCLECGTVLASKKIITKATGHKWTPFKVVNEATVFKTGLLRRECKYCGKTEDKKISKLKPTITLSAKKKTLKAKKTYKLIISNLAKGDSIAGIYSSKTAIAKVKSIKKNQYLITAKSKGNCKITILLKSGKKATCKITVK